MSGGTGWTAPVVERARNETCWRVPIVIDATVLVHHRGDSRKVERHGFDRVEQVTNSQPWGPIVSALNASGAVAKVREIYPRAVVGEPFALHRPGTHLPTEFADKESAAAAIAAVRARTHSRGASS